MREYFMFTEANKMGGSVKLGNLSKISNILFSMWRRWQLLYVVAPHLASLASLLSARSVPCMSWINVPGLRMTLILCTLWSATEDVCFGIFLHHALRTFGIISEPACTY